MASNEDVLKAVQKLTRSYEQLQGEVEVLNQQKPFSVPLYSDGICYWDGYENLSADSDLYNNILTYGSVTSKALYGSWYSAYMITLNQGGAFAQPKAGMPSRCFVIKVHLNDLTNNKKTFFVKQCNADSQAYGYYSAYLCNKNTLVPYKFLGTDEADKGSGEGRSIRYNMFNGASQQMRYHQWITFNFDLDKATDSIDSEGYVYIGITSTVATFYISGWGIANRNTDFVWQNAYVMTYGSLPMSGVPVYNTTNTNGLCQSYFARNTQYVGLEIPYEECLYDEGDLLVSFFDSPYDPVYQADMKLQGNVSGTVFNQDAIHIGNYGRCVYNGGDSSNIVVTSFVIPHNELVENTVLRNGKKYLCVDIPKFLADRHFYFCGLYTEEYKGV